MTGFWIAAGGLLLAFAGLVVIGMTHSERASIGRALWRMRWGLAFAALFLVSVLALRG